MKNIYMTGNVWIEKTLVKGREDRLVGDRSIGSALWSPKSGSDGRNTYKNMLLVKAGDLIIHLIDNSVISGLSIVENEAKDADGLAGTNWEGPSYFIKLKNYSILEKPVERGDLLNESHKALLHKIAKDSEVFYNKSLTLRQGGYLTPCPIELLVLINKCYRKHTNNNLPFVDSLGINFESYLGKENFSIKELYNALIHANIKVSAELATRFVASLIAKPFLILTGLSGSGKTKLAQAFSMWICESENQYCIVPVGADWTNREPLLGYPNALVENDYKMDDFGVLKLILEANKNKSKPYFLILDEMNLSHVERYFSDFLSVMESKSRISLHSGSVSWGLVPPEIEFPKNLFIIGTVNIDETTYMFSPKVLDRSNVIEFRISADEMGMFLEDIEEIDTQKLEKSGALMASKFIEMAMNKGLKVSDTKELNLSLMSFFSELKNVGTEFGFRSASEIVRFAAVVQEIDDSWKMNEIIDIAIMQKILPKIHGSRKKLVGPLETLAGFCLERFDGAPEVDTSNKLKTKYQQFISEKRNDSIWEVKYSISFEKIERMLKNVIENGFTSYAEA